MWELRSRARKFRFIAVVGVFLATELAVLAAAGDDGKFAKKSQAFAAKRQALIDKELQSLKNHAWAGDYYYGDGLGVNVDLRLAPKSGFVFTWHGCLGLYDLNYGDVVEKPDGRISFVFKFSNEQKGFEGLAAELLPVAWGERHYLIPADDVVGFANGINAGIEPRTTTHGRFLLKWGDEEKSAPGQPSLPPQYLKYLLSYPINAEISSVEGIRIEKSRHIATVQLNVGVAEGVKPGMEFYVHTPSTVYESALILAVEGPFSRAQIVQDDEIDGKEPRPAVGWKLSTVLSPN